MQTPLQIKNGQTALFNMRDFVSEESSTSFLASCDPRVVFESEADFERTLMHDANALESISEALGIEIDAVARQVKTGRTLAQRADLVVVGAGATKPLAVIELMITQMDGEHVTRAFGYACALRARDVVLIAPGFPQSVKNLIEQLRHATERLGITIHLVQLHTETSTDLTQGFFRLERLTAARQPRPQVAFLEVLAARAAELGDDSLLGCPINDGRRVDSYQGLGNHARIRVYSGHGTARIAIIVTSARIHRRLMKKRLPEHLKQSLQNYQLEQASFGGKTLVASYRFPTEAVGAANSDLGLTRVALAYRKVRMELMHAIGDASRAPSAKARPVRYRQPRGGYHLIPRSLLYLSENRRNGSNAPDAYDHPMPGTD
jgi:hypothetical protein